MQTRGYNSNRARSSRRLFVPRQQLPKEPRRIPTALGPTVRSLVLDEIDVFVNPDIAEITDCEFIASYNLMDNLCKTIIVPGRPPLWTPSSDKMKLSADSGNYYRDENAARFPEYPLEPAVRSILHINPSFDTTSIDIFACGSTLGNLLRFVQGTGEPFSFVVHTIGQTAFFVRRDLSPSELIEGVIGFGHSFVEANTTWSQDVKGSSSHQRIIKYRLAGKEMLVRFEADAYTMNQADELDADESDGGVPVPSSAEVDDLVHMLRPQAPSTISKEVVLLEKGSRTALSSTIDIKTRSFRKKRYQVLAEQLPRLWLRQIDNLVLSFHDNGVFEPAAVEDISSLISDWEEQNQSVIARLINLADMITSAARKAVGGKLEVRCAETSSLHLHELSPTEQSKWHAIPDNLRTLWTQN